MLLKKRINSFFEESDQLKTFNNLCLYLDLTKDEFMRTMNNDPEDAELLIKAYERCEAWLIDNALASPKSGNFTQFLLKHQFDYIEKETQAESQPTLIQIVPA